MFPFLLVGAGGAIGAMARFGFSQLVGRFSSAGFPLATLVINILGSFAMGLVMGLLAKFNPSWSEGARLFLTVGILGGFTTFSAFSLDTIVLLERGEWVMAGLYVLLSVALCLIGLYLGLLLTRGVA